MTSVFTPETPPRETERAEDVALRLLIQKQNLRDAASAGLELLIRARAPHHLKHATERFVEDCEGDLRLAIQHYNTAMQLAQETTS